MELDAENYQYTMIGSTSDRFLWILSRTPSLPEKTLQMLLENARKRGYQVEDLIMVPQKSF